VVPQSRISCVNCTQLWDIRDWEPLMQVRGKATPKGIRWRATGCPFTEKGAAFHQICQGWRYPHLRLATFYVGSVKWHPCGYSVKCHFNEMALQWKGTPPNLKLLKFSLFFLSLLKTKALNIVFLEWKKLWKDLILNVKNYLFNLHKWCHNVG
jgi:hypothetical protein